jgi:hypothetical protein
MIFNTKQTKYEECIMFTCNYLFSYSRLCFIFMSKFVACANFNINMHWASKLDMFQSDIYIDLYFLKFQIISALKKSKRDNNSSIAKLKKLQFSKGKLINLKVIPTSYKRPRRKRWKKIFWKLEKCFQITKTDFCKNSQEWSKGLWALKCWSLVRLGVCVYTIKNGSENNLSFNKFFVIFKLSHTSLWCWQSGITKRSNKFL